MSELVPPKESGIRPASIIDLIQKRLLDSGENAVTITRDRTRHDTLARPDSRQSENQYLPNPGAESEPAPDTMFRIVEIEMEDGRVALIASIDNLDPTVADITQPFSLKGLVYIPGKDDYDKDKYTLAFEDHKGQKMITIETAHDHRFKEMNLSPIIQQLLLEMKESNILTNTMPNAKAESHKMLFRPQSYSERAKLAGILTNPKFKAVPPDPVKLGFNPLPTGGSGTVA